MIRSMYRPQDGSLRFDLPTTEFAMALIAPNGLLWIDIVEEPPEKSELILREVFDFHPLAIDDALQESHVPKVDDWGSYLYLVLHAIVCEQQPKIEVRTQEMDVFLGANYLITLHHERIAAVDHVWNAYQRGDRHLRRGSDHLMYRVIDTIVAEYMPVMDSIDEAIDLLEDQIFDRPTPQTLEDLFGLKRSLLYLRRIIGPQREVLNKLARDDYTVIDSKDKVFFRDVYDHLVRLHDIAESLRDLVGGSLDTYLSLVNNRMNEVMKTLTIITSLFMPLSFVVGFFGMNFFASPDPRPAWMGDPVFYLTLLGMAVAPAFMFWWMRQRRWL
ncbi:MAG: magnesium/cobalt transporter CorA [Chloroflexi bacterium]|nr:magnesium/cobalt transporter CorA [Chloroflexota bacterium]MCI0577872.1 magnesium/cobalt transporter CorA [Chloroflexota bacterium]MCI0644492.1 magnesium/cobalt transporter CorA [Chloroflexota bacterium]MCI0730240.1 magnesium/cobalt transporter CorA [Chloroflexota bacterium]